MAWIEMQACAGVNNKQDQHRDIDRMHEDFVSDSFIGKKYHYNYLNVPFLDTCSNEPSIWFD